MFTPTWKLTWKWCMSLWIGIQQTTGACGACLVLSFRSLLRKSNLVPDSVANPIGHFIRRGALSFTEWGMEISISSSKQCNTARRYLRYQ